MNFLDLLPLLFGGFGGGGFGGFNPFMVPFLQGLQQQGNLTPNQPAQQGGGFFQMLAQQLAPMLQQPMQPQTAQMADVQTITAPPPPGVPPPTSLDPRSTPAPTPTVPGAAGGGAGMSGAPSPQGAGGAPVAPPQPYYQGAPGTFQTSTNLLDFIRRKNI